MRTNRQPEGLRLPSSITEDAALEQHLRESAWQRIVRGDDDAEGYVEWMTDDDDQSVTAGQAAAAFAYVRAARVEQQAGWSDEPTNLTRAFDALAERGVLARANFSCCGTCADAEIWDELDDTRDWRGYLYFHMQDTERLVEDRETYVGYGVFVPAYVSERDWNALSDDERWRRETELTAGLMDEVRQVLEAEGIGWQWNGDLRHRILLTNVDYFISVR